MTHNASLTLTRIRSIALFFSLLSGVIFLNFRLFSRFEITASLQLHTAIEIVTVVLFAAIFIVCWNTLEAIRKTNNVVLAVAFLCAAIFEFLHAITFQGMPGFLSVHDLHNSVNFYLLSQYIVGATLFGMAIKSDDSPISDKKSLMILGLGLGFTFVVSMMIVFSRTIFQLNNLSDQGLTSIVIVSEMGLVAIHILNTFLFFKQINGDQKAYIKYFKIERAYLFLASCILALSQIYFLPFFQKSEIFVLVGHIFLLFAAFIIYRSMAVINIDAPHSKMTNASAELRATFEELTLHKERLSGIIETAIDGIVTVNKKQEIVVINSAAAAMFGYAVESLQHKSLDQVIPNRHRKNHGEHINKFGNTGATKRKMGTSFEDFYITGLRADGSEFPIEASISSSLENGERFYTVIFRDITERKNAKDKLALYHTQLSQFSAALQSIREEERKHIARELHDDLGQLLAALRMDLSLLQRDTALSEKSQKNVDSMDQLILTSITTLRRIASDLRPRALDESGLFYALKTLQKEFSSRHHVDCELVADEEQLTLDDALSTTIFRVIQESLTNVARHANASEVQIEFNRDASSIRFSIRDNGCGIDENDMKKTRSFGLVGMRERIKAMHGEFSVTSTFGDGTLLEISLPILKTSDLQQDFRD